MKNDLTIAKVEVGNLNVIAILHDIHRIMKDDQRNFVSLRIVFQKFEFLKEFISQKVWELGQVYLLVLNKEITDFNLQKDEVDEIKWISLTEFRTILYSSEFVPYDK